MGELIENEFFEEKVYCDQCKRKTNHIILENYSVNYEDTYNESEWEKGYYIAQCAGCDEINFIKTFFDSDMVNYFDNNLEENTVIEVFPKMPLNFEEYITYNKKSYRRLPKNLKKIYEEATKAYEEGLYTLTCVGIRMLLEGLCSDLGNEGYAFIKVSENEKISKYEVKLNGNKEIVKRNTLENKIFMLYYEKIITLKQMELLFEIKGIGNAAVHELKVPEHSDIVKMFEVVDLILFMQYELKRITSD